MFILCEVYRIEIWGGLYCLEPGTARPKRHILWSNDETLLKRIRDLVGHATREQLQAMGGEVLVVPYTKNDGTTGFSGNGETMKQSQSLGCKFKNMSNIENKTPVMYSIKSVNDKP